MMIFSSRAQRDLIKLAELACFDGELAVRRLVDQALSEPEGDALEEWGSEGLVRWSLEGINVVLFARHVDDQLVVIRILNTAMKTPQILG